MPVSASSASPWPSRVAYAASAVFLAASGSINITYGWAKGETFASSLTWAAVSAGVAVVFALAWPALIRARSWSEIGVALAALILAGSYSITAALGSAAGSRYNAANTEQTATDARKRARAAYDAATAEIATIEPSRPAAELLPLVEAAKPQCRVRVDSAGRQTVCSKPSALLAELGRAHRRAELQDKADKADAVLNAAPARQANSDANALGRYLSAIGLEVSDARLNDLLTILAVVMIEAEGGLALALGLALTPATRTTDERLTERFRTPEQNALHTPASGVRPVTVRPSTVADWLALQGGKAKTSMRRLAAEMGRSPSAVHDELRRLVVAGTITMASGPKGTDLALRRN
jgi:hypothetical protein